MLRVRFHKFNQCKWFPSIAGSAAGPWAPSEARRVQKDPPYLLTSLKPALHHVAVSNSSG